MNSVANDILPLVRGFLAGDWLGCVVTNSTGFKALAISGALRMTYVS